VDGPLGRSGFLAAFSLIFLSEMGDKTFFIAALLAMRLGKWVALRMPRGCHVSEVLVKHPRAAVLSRSCSSVWRVARARERVR
jgi:putative Ca2+/H+ antiporter (TMEM165/GDT1 family)